MLTATGEVLTGWLASQSDMLAEDWHAFKEFKKIS
jgi:cytochrome b